MLVRKKLGLRSTLSSIRTIDMRLLVYSLETLQATGDHVSEVLMRRLLTAGVGQLATLNSPSHGSRRAAICMV